MLELDMADSSSSYRDLLLRLQQEMQTAYDKAIMTLSGGALAVSMAFIKDIVGSKPAQAPALIGLSWTCWGLSICCIVASYIVSAHAMEHQIEIEDRKTQKLACGEKPDFSEPPGGTFDTVTRNLNIASGICFFFGVILMAIFVSINL